MPARISRRPSSEDPASVEKFFALLKASAGTNGHLFAGTRGGPEAFTGNWKARLYDPRSDPAGTGRPALPATGWRLFRFPTIYLFSRPARRR